MRFRFVFKVEKGRSMGGSPSPDRFDDWTRSIMRSSPSMSA